MESPEFLDAIEHKIRVARNSEILRILDLTKRNPRAHELKVRLVIRQTRNGEFVENYGWWVHVMEVNNNKIRIRFYDNHTDHGDTEIKRGSEFIIEPRQITDIRHRQ